MIGYALAISVVLAGQVGPAADRYPPRATGPAATGASTADSAASSNLAPFGNQPAATNSGSSRTSTTNTTPSSGATSPYRTAPPPGVATPRTPPLIDSTSAPAAAGQSPAPSAYPAQPNFPANEPASTQPASGLKPSAMMRAMLTAPRDTQLAGDTIPLVEVVSGAKSRSEQTQRVDAYWDLCSSVADYYLGLGEQEVLRKLRSYVPRGGATWQQAESELGVRIGTSLRAARAAQLRVASWIGRETGNLPLPLDMPHCASYHAHFEEIFAGRASAEAQELATLLPLRYAELKDAATAVTRAEQWLDAVARAGNENSDGTGSLRALELLALRRRAFVQIARDYNRRIARYSELATPGQISAERLVGMLIKSAHSSTATRSASPAPPGNRQSKNAAGPPRTFVEDWTPVRRAGSATETRGRGVEPASATQSSPRRERSLLVAPK